MRLLPLLALLAACPSSQPKVPVIKRGPTGTRVITIVGTNDLHGRVQALPVLAGYVSILRELRARDGGVLLLDAGDMFQGTLESNLGEGAAVVRAYNAIGYSAAAVGNHEFDFGPAGEAATPRAPSDDPRGALKARAAEAKFPFLAANLVETGTNKRPEWPNMPAATVIEVAGVRVGVIGVTTMGTATSTISANFAGLETAELAETIAAQAKTLRGAGVDLVVVTAHAGGDCKEFEDARTLTSCDQREEIFQVALALPRGSVDAIVGGHSHAGVAHIVNGIPIIESWANGRAFGRIDLTWDGDARRVADLVIHPPRDLCEREAPACEAGTYEGKPVVTDKAVEALLQPDIEKARQLREQKLGVTVAKKIWRAYGEESPLGNLFADLMRQARPQADVALQNGGGLRADIPAGELTYGQLYEAFPFDNRFAVVRLSGAGLKKLLRDNLSRSGGILSVSGVRVVATCAGGDLSVEVRREGGAAILDQEEITLVTSDFLATGGDGALARGAQTTVEDALIREEMAALLRKRGGALSSDDKSVYDEASPRVSYPTERPVKCAP